MSEEKESITDDIDVSECNYFIDHTPSKEQGDWCGAIHKGACKVYSKDCEYNKDCYFKQLKRLQKENEELKARLITLDDEVLTIEITLDEFERYKKYKQTLEEIKKTILNYESKEWNCFNDMDTKLEKISEILDEALK